MQLERSGGNFCFFKELKPSWIDLRMKQVFKVIKLFSCITVQFYNQNQYTPYIAVKPVLRGQVRDPC